jgi:ribosome-associated protein
MDPTERLKIQLGDEGEPINLTQVLKRAGCVMSGGEGKTLVASGLVRVNGEVEFRKRRQMSRGDVVAIEGGPTIELT